MNAGKSTHLLQSSYNYRERSLNTLLFTAKIDNRFSHGKVSSRLGIDADATLFDDNSNIFFEVKTSLESNKLAWDDPVKISIFDLLVMLVLFRVERFEVVPAETNSFLEALKAVQNGAFVIALAL